MKIVIIRPFSRTAFELAGYCARALINLGNEVVIFNFRYDYPLFFNKIGFFYNRLTLIKIIKEFKPDFLFVIKGERIPLEIITEIRKNFKIPIVNWWIDDPLWIKISKTISPFYDYFFTNDPNSIKVHQDSGCPNVKFLTFGCAPDIHRKINLTEKEKKELGSDICFSGTIVPKREKFLETLVDFNLKIWWQPITQDTDKEIKIKKRKISPSSPLFHKFTGKDVWGEEMVKVFNSSKICLNIHSQEGAGTNMRTFEVTGCGSFLLCESREILPDLFKIGEEIVCFKEPDELKELAKYYLSHPSEREKISKKGQERVYKEHTYKHRMKEMLSVIQKWKYQKKEL